MIIIVSAVMSATFSEHFQSNTLCTSLTHWGLLMPYGSRHFIQLWFRQWLGASYLCFVWAITFSKFYCAWGFSWKVTFALPKFALSNSNLHRLIYPKYKTCCPELNSFRSSDVRWRHIAGSTLAQVMVKMLLDSTKPLPEPMLTYHHRWVLWHSHVNNFPGNTLDIYLLDEFENHMFRITAASPRGQWVKEKLPISACFSDLPWPLGLKRK